MWESVYCKCAPRTFEVDHIVAIATAWMNSYHESERCRVNPYTGRLEGLNLNVSKHVQQPR